MWLMVVSATILAACIHAEIVDVLKASPGVRRDLLSSQRYDVKRTQPNIPIRRSTSSEDRTKRLLANRAQKTANRQHLKQFQATDFPLPTVNLPTDMPSQRTEMTTESSEMTTQSSTMTSSWSSPTEMSSTWSSGSSTYLTGSTETYSTYSTENPEKCADDYAECGSWLRDYYDNNLVKFCGKYGYDWWCCGTCLSWETKSEECKDEYSACREVLEAIYYNDFDSFCLGWEDTCCATCSDGDNGNKPDECVDKGYGGSTCESLLKWGVDGDMKEMCGLFGKECCKMCSDTSEEKQPDECEDTGYNNSSCEDLLKWGVDGDMEKMCDLFEEECCSMCSRKRDKGNDRDAMRK
ncbi:uncharacterized protein LOC123536788 [Mercenaria mercenaria]|uniref:uncharacterized protein LOC123536788 n=1 Tax=Mercenaria mercenaria TaxID=6596 RepID=UPI00234EC982|nr:uncharacterized protein LOC123536788 [Mercenaria mercenaria]